MSNLTPETVVRQTPNQVSAEMGDETAVLNMDSGQYFGLNISSSEIWEFIEEPRAIREICEHLQTQFEVDAEQCKKEVFDHLGKLIEDELVEIQGGDGG